jgi:hypothetical protein
MATGVCPWEWIRRVNRGRGTGRHGDAQRCSRQTFRSPRTPPTQADLPQVRPGGGLGCSLRRFGADHGCPAHLTAPRSRPLDVSHDVPAAA